MIVLIEKICLLMIVAIGVISIYDARILAKKIFNNSDRNSAVLLLRIVGFLISIISAIIICILN